MNSPILQLTARLVLPVLLMFSIIVLLRGHNEPGGGFVAGLIAASGLALHAMSFGPAPTRRLMRVDLHHMLAMGVALAGLSGLIAVVSGGTYMESRWAELDVPWLGHLKVGTPMMFDLGVYIVVIGVAMMMILSLAEE